MFYFFKYLKDMRIFQIIYSMQEVNYDTIKLGLQKEN